MLYLTIPILANISSNTPQDLGAYTSSIIGVILTGAALAALLYLLLGGINWITGAGDKGKLEEARGKITGALVGLAIVAVSWAIFLVIDSFFGLGLAGGKSSTYSVTTGGGNSGGGNTTNTNISFNCITITRCNGYCTDPGFYTVTNDQITCGANTIGCACVDKTNPKVNPCPTGYHCN